MIGDGECKISIQTSAIPKIIFRNEETEFFTEVLFGRDRLDNKESDDGATWGILIMMVNLICLVVEKSIRIAKGVIKPSKVHSKTMMGIWMYLVTMDNDGDLDMIIPGMPASFNKK